MATKRDARAMGYDIGYEIASESDNFRDAFNTFAKEETGGMWEKGVPADKKTEVELIQHIASEACSTESDHYRQFSPFEFTAREFNDSSDPDGVWEAYDDGVYKGAIAGAKDALKKFTRKAFVLVD